MSAEVILDVWLTNPWGERQRAGRLVVAAPDVSLDIPPMRAPSLVP